MWGPLVSDEEPARERDVERANVKLAQGLKACRAVVAGYRAMLSGETGENPDQERVEDDSPTTAAADEPEQA
jgi:hypothetical protein